MISRTLVRLIDQAIVPAILLLCTRFISVVMLTYLFGIKFSTSPKGFTFSSVQDYLFINSYSTLAMVIILGVGLLYILIKALYFHNTHISPSLTTKLFHHRLATLIQSSFELYSQGVIWLIYLYLIGAVSVILAVFDYIYNWVSVAALIMAGISTLILIIDVEKELESVEAGYHEEENPAEILEESNNALRS